MVSLWPFRRSNTSAETFEKTLSALAQKIAKQTAHNDRIRQRARRIKVSWTLYGGFAYILAAIVLIFVTGMANWGVVEYTVMAGGPFLLYAVRAGSDAWYNYRITKSQNYLDSLFKERDSTIEKLKEATKYNSTEQLLKKYGSPRPSLSGEPGSEKKSKSPGSGKKNQGGNRIFMPPPPTANIQRLPTQQHFAPPQPSPPAPAHAPPPVQRPLSSTDPSPTAEFAPNAFDVRTQRTPAPSSGTAHWYDRLLDALLGEDETQAALRFALICRRCRLVNGRAPPGARSLEDVGVWRCQGCGAVNGAESDAEGLAEVVRKDARKVEVRAEEEEEGDEGGVETPAEEEVGEDGDGEKDEAEETPPAHETRSKAKKGS